LGRRVQGPRQAPVNPLAAGQREKDGSQKMAISLHRAGIRFPDVDHVGTAFPFSHLWTDLFIAKQVGDEPELERR